MARRTMSIRELRRALAAQEKRVTKLVVQRKQLAARLRDLDAQIVGLGGEVPAAPKKPGRKPGKKVAKPVRRGRKPAAKRAKRRKRATGRPLAEYIIDVLKKAGGGMRVKDVMAAVRKAGYASMSKDFYGIVAATLRDSKQFKKLSRGVYALA
jgi:hypothetical protein